MVVFWQKLLHSSKLVLIGKIGCIRLKVVVFGVKRLYSGKNVVFGTKVVVYGQSFLFFN